MSDKNFRLAFEYGQAHDHFNANRRENNRTNPDERNWRRLKSNGGELDHAEGTKFEAVDAAQIWRNKQECERYHKWTAERWICEACNACSFETAEEADAHETLCAAEKSLATKWACDVCKSCSFETFEEAEALRETVLPMPPPSRRGRKPRKTQFCFTAGF